MSVALKKLDGVESVDVSLEKASADITLRPDNRLTIERIRQVIRSNGYPTRDAEITARGRIVDRNGRLGLDLLNGSSLALVERPKAAGDSVVEVTGVSRAQGKGPDHMTIKTVK